MKKLNVFREQAKDGGGTAGSDSIIIPAGGNTIPIIDNSKTPEPTPTPTPTPEPKVEPTPIPIPEPTSNPIIADITIDGIDYKIDDKGNALKSDGSIFMTKEQIDSFSTTDDMISQIQKINNIIINDEQGNPVLYGATPEGLAKRELDIVNHVKTITTQEAITNFLQTNPDIQAMYDYKNKYGTLEGFGTKVDYTTINLDKNNKEQLKQFIIESQLVKGNNLEISKGYADYAEKNNLLDKLGEEAFNNLKTDQVKQITESQNALKEYHTKYYGIEVDKNGNIKDLKQEGSVYDLIVNKGEFNNIKLPKDGFIVKDTKGNPIKATAKDLFEYATFSNDNSGKSEMDKLIDTYLQTPANKLTIGLYILKGGDLSEFGDIARNSAIVKKVINTKQNNTSRQILNTTKGDKENIVLPM